jgi:hypothetical protein
LAKARGDVETRIRISRSGLEPLLKKRDRFNGSSGQCIAERFTLELHLDEGDLNGRYAMYG